MAVSIRIYEPVLSLDHKNIMLSGEVKNTKFCARQQLSKVDIVGKTTLLSLMNMDYSDGFSDDYLCLCARPEFHNTRFDSYKQTIHNKFSDMQVPMYFKPYDIEVQALKVKCLYSKDGEYATDHFYNRPYTQFFAFNEDSAEKIINRYIRKEYRSEIVKALALMKDNTIFELTF